MLPPVIDLVSFFSHLWGNSILQYKLHHTSGQCTNLKKLYSSVGSHSNTWVVTISTPSHSIYSFFSAELHHIMRREHIFSFTLCS